MRPPSTLLACLLCAAVLLALAPAAAASHGCRASSGRGADVLQATRYGVVFEKRDRVYGCLFSTGTVHNVPADGAPDRRRADDFALDGRYVAFHGILESGEDADPRILVFDLRRGRVTLSTPSVRIGETTSPQTDAQAIVVKKNGSVAWIARTPGGPFEVRKVDRGTGEEGAALDQGADVAPTSLAKSRDDLTVYWTRAGEPRSAPLR